MSLQNEGKGTPTPAAKYTHTNQYMIEVCINQGAWLIDDRFVNISTAPSAGRIPVPQYQPEYPKPCRTGTLIIYCLFSGVELVLPPSSLFEFQYFSIYFNIVSIYFFHCIPILTRILRSRIRRSYRWLCPCVA